MGAAAEIPSTPSLNPNWIVLKQKLNGRNSGSSTYPSTSGKPPSFLGTLKKLSRSSSLPTHAFPSSITKMMICQALFGAGKRKERSDAESKVHLSIIAPFDRSSDGALFSLTDELAMDCEMVGVGPQGTKSAIARVVLVNAYGNVVYDNYVRPLERVVDFRTRISGIRPRHLKKAKDFRKVQNDVSAIIKGRTLIGHALHNDLKALLMTHPRSDLRDTAEYQPFLSEQGRRRALRDLASQILGVAIQQGEHCPVEDARAAMMIFQKHKKKWEKLMKRELKRKTYKKDGRRKNKKRKKFIDAD